jgi:hypothetical protein
MQKVLEVDPTNASAQKIIDALSKPAKQPASKQKGGPYQSADK